MKPEEAIISILALSEDSSKDAPATLEALTKKMIRLVEESVQTHRINFDPDARRVAKSVHANIWKSKNAKHEPMLRELVGTIATKLLQTEPYGFVFFHFDGDTIWKNRPSLNSKSFADIIEIRVRQRITDFLRNKKLSAQDVEAQTAAALERLIQVTPFYSMEAWLYQNTTRAKALCTERCGKHATKLDQWAADRTLLDDLDKPKLELCIAADSNLTLAESAFPAREVEAAGRSFAEVIARLRACSSLRRALA